LAANPQPEGQARVDVFSNNTLSAYAVLQVAGDVGVRRVVYASSETVTGVLHGERPSQIPFDESERHDAPNAYALSKYLSEVIADSMAVRYPGMSFVGLRLSNVIPANEVGRAMMAERREDPAKGMFNYWSYVDARDVGTAFQAALEGTSEGNEVFLVAAADTSSDRPLRELLETYYPGEGLAERVAPGHPDDASVFDCGKMRRYFGWEPQYSWRSGN
jgi:nucleoside-diphosphate-sugar epimerase